MIEYQGVQYSSLKDVAKAFGIKYDTFLYRYKKWGIDRAVKEEVGTVRRKSEIFPEDIIELAEENGIAYHTLYRRYMKGMDMFDAAIEPSAKHGRPSMLSKEEKALAEKYGINESTARARINRGFMSRYDALTMKQKDFWRIDDIYLSIEQVNTARANGLDRELVYNRVYVLGYEVEQAITMPRQQKFGNEKKENVG